MIWTAALCLFLDPGWGIVRTQTGKIYAGDVIRNVVWSVDTSGRVEAAIRDRHAHALAIDGRGRLMGDQTDYDPRTQKFSRWVWRLENGVAVRLDVTPSWLGKPQGLPAGIPKLSGWEISGATESASDWFVLEHIPMQEFEGIHTRQGPYLQVRRIGKANGNSTVILSVSRSSP